MRNNSLENDFLKFFGKTKISENSKEYIACLEKIAATFDGEIKIHSEKGKRVFCKKCDTVMSSIGFGGYPVKCLCKCESEAIETEKEHVKTIDNMRRIEN